MLYRAIWHWLQYCQIPAWLIELIIVGILIIVCFIILMCLFNNIFGSGWTSCCDTASLMTLSSKILFLWLLTVLFEIIIILSYLVMCQFIVGHMWILSYSLEHLCSLCFCIFSIVWIQPYTIANFCSIVPFCQSIFLCANLKVNHNLTTFVA